MKKLLLSAIVLLACVSCYDDTQLWESLNDHENRISELEELCSGLNTDLSSLQTIVNALEINDYVTGVVPVEENGKEIGYTIKFAKSSSIIIYHGKDGNDGKDGNNGNDGSVPSIGIRLDSDGKHYWVLDGSWMLDESGNRIPATGENGKDGADGKPGEEGAPGQDGAEGKPGNDGKDGEDGKDGVTPQLKIESNYWFVSYDNGDTWNKLGKATGEDGNNGTDGDSLFAEVDYTTDFSYVIFTLNDGYSIKIPTWTAYEELAAMCQEMNSSIQTIQVLIGSLNNYDFVASISPVMDGSKEIGCTIKFTKGRTITVYYGSASEGGNTSAGTGATTPQIGVRQDTDGKYYWTLAGEWLLDDTGAKIPTTGEDGKDGTDGEPGADGKDGVTPQFKIENKYWYVSYDAGLTWNELGKAVGEDGADGNDGADGIGSGSLFNSVEYSSDGSYVVFTLTDSTAIKLPTWAAHESLAAECRQANDNIKALQEIISALQNCDYITEVIPIVEGGKEVGYIMKFFKGGSVTIYHGQDGRDGDSGADGQQGQDGTDGKDGVSPVIGVKQLDGVYYWTLNGEWLLDDDGNKIPTTGKDGQDGAPGQDGADGLDAVTPLLKIEDNVWYVSYDGGQNWNMISSDDENGSGSTESSSCMFKNVEWDERNVYLTLNDDTTLTIPIYGEIEILFEEKDGITCLAGQTVTIGYTLYGSDNKTVVECITDNGWRAFVKQTSVQTGEITVSAPTPLTEGKVLVFVSNGMGRTYMTVLRFNKGTLTVGTPVYYANATGGSITIDVVTDVNYSVRIADAPDWIKYVPATKAEIRTDHLTFSLEANPVMNERSALVELVDEEGLVLEEFKITQKGNKEGGIVFEDSLVEEICLANFDTDQDSLITTNELMAVKSIGTLFQLKAIRKFNELQYFTNVTTLEKQAFYGCNSLEEITLPNSLTAIYSEAFEFCYALKNVNIPSSVQTIGERAFSSCRVLESISLPEGLKSIEQYTFNACYALKSIHLPESLEYIKNNSFQGAALSSVDFPKNLITIGSSAFLNCTNLNYAVLPEGLIYLEPDAFNNCAFTSINIPSTVSVIGAGAFANCSNLKEVTLSEGLLTIGSRAFYDCYAIESISLPSTLTYIESCAFERCDALKSIEIPDKVKIIEDAAFDECRSLTEVQLPDELLTIGQNAFDGCSALESIEIPESVKYIRSNAFNSCTSLKNIKLPDDLYELGQGAFSNCDALEEFVLPNNLTSLYSTFNGCENLKSVTLPSGLLTINRTFEGCTSLESIVIPETVKEIDWYSFSGCKSLKKINLPESITTIESDCFKNCESLTEINWPSGLKSIGSYAFLGTNITNGNFPSSLTSIGSYAFQSCTGLTKVVLPEGITKINERVFYNCTNLQEIDIPKTVTSIGSHAFERCSELTEVNLPDNITSIEDYAFQECTKLREFTCPELLREIPSYMLYGCDSLKSVHFHEAITKIGSYAFAECQNLSELTLPDCLTSIPSSMCVNCSELTSIVIPSGITAIGSSAFDSCRRLSEVICNPATPPTLSSYAFDDIYPTAKFYVPAASLDTYKEAAGWKTFSSSMSAIVEE